MAALSVLVITIVLCFISLGECQDQPEITKVILPEIKRAGETGALNCSITRQKDNKVYWIEQLSRTIISSDDSIDVEEKFNPIIDGFPKYEVIKTIDAKTKDDVTYTLIIRRLQLTDAGVYVCQVQIKGISDSPSKEGQMIVLLPPNIIQRATTQTTTVSEGADVKLQCVADGYPEPKIKWVRPNGRALPLPGLPFAIQNTTLYLNDIKKEDRGVFRCIADNDVRPFDSYDSTVYVEFMPAAKPVQTSYGQAQNRMFDVTIECRIAGTPEPELRWFQMEGEEGMIPIQNDDRHLIHTLHSHGNELSISEYWFQLTIINVQANDYGRFFCEGTNKLGSSGNYVSLYETSECQGPNCPEEGRPAGVSIMVTASLVLTIATSLATLYHTS
jgi:limbic system-associated membrane protein